MSSVVAAAPPSRERQALDLPWHSEAALTLCDAAVKQMRWPSPSDLPMPALFPCPPVHTRTLMMPEQPARRDTPPTIRPVRCSRDPSTESTAHGRRESVVPFAAPLPPPPPPPPPPFPPQLVSHTQPRHTQKGVAPPPPSGPTTSPRRRHSQSKGSQSRASRSSAQRTVPPRVASTSSKGHTRLGSREPVTGMSSRPKSAAVSPPAENASLAEARHYLDHMEDLYRRLRSTYEAIETSGTMPELANPHGALAEEAKETASTAPRQLPSVTSSAPQKTPGHHLPAVARPAACVAPPTALLSREMMALEQQWSRLESLRNGPAVSSTSDMPTRLTQESFNTSQDTTHMTHTSAKEDVLDFIRGRRALLSEGY